MGPDLALSCIHVCVPDGASPAERQKVALEYQPDPDPNATPVSLHGEYLPDQSDPAHDLAVLRVALPARLHIPPVPLSCDDQPREKAVAFGFPDQQPAPRRVPGVIDPISYTDAVCFEDDWTCPVLHLDTKGQEFWSNQVVRHGMNGGPIWNERAGTVVAVVEGRKPRGFTPGDMPEGYGIPVKHLHCSAEVRPLLQRSRRVNWHKLFLVAVGVGLAFMLSQRFWGSTQIPIRPPPEPVMNVNTGGEAALPQTFLAKWFMKTTIGFLHGGFGEGRESDRTIRFLGPEQFDSWIWDGSSWKELKNSHLTLTRHAMAYHKKLKKMVIFGGWTGLYRSNETWMWSGENWTEVSKTGPTNRQNHALVFDEKRDSIILFGGLTVELFGGSVVGQIALGDTWEWNGSRWSQLHVKGPEPRWGHQMIYDEVRRVIVLFGGYDGSRYFNDTWIWEGTTGTWSKVTTTNSPAARRCHGMSFDGRNGKALLFAGKTDGDSSLNDLWEWDGSVWKPVRQEAPPEPRHDHGMVYDKKREVTILFGGYDGARYFRDTWELTY